jgi:hypothetical protein
MASLLRIVSLLLLTYSFALIAVQPAAAQKCSSGMSLCEKGRFGNGGCYARSSVNCIEGATCSKSMSFCEPGRYGKGGCYARDAVNCIEGATCSKSMHYCPKGPKGNGGCYAAGRRCDGGRIL